jgi:acyl-CoA synthetase (AMP-forming)/AMP-acid ligase II
VDKRANRIGHWARARGIKQGDVVALYMENKPEFIMTWLGIAKIGGVTALINHNLKGKVLVHSVSISGGTTFIVDSTLADTVKAVAPQLLAKGFKLISFGGNVGFSENIDDVLDNFSDKRIPKSERSTRKFTDTALLVYTSGTTGMPKAATIKHFRFFTMGAGFSTIFEVGPSDRVYCVLPLYHSAGGLCGVGMTITAGATMVLKRKFSSKSFWDDCREHKVTVVQYIGELCRYLLGGPKRPNDSKNNVRIAIGNGLRPEIWDEFQERFGIPQIGEFYGSTEGVGALFNFCTTKEARGSVGHMGWLLKKLTKLKVVKFDVDLDAPKRGKDGFLVECDAGEVGELLGQIDDSDPLRRFSGYHGNKKATNKKIIFDAFTKGDKWFRSGDLMKHDAKGYWHFVDRIGDTFRWKGTYPLCVVFCFCLFLLVSNVWVSHFHNSRIASHGLVVSRRKCQHYRGCGSRVRL